MVQTGSGPISGNAEQGYYFQIKKKERKIRKINENIKIRFRINSSSFRTKESLLPHL